MFPACACSESSTLKLACQRVSALEKKVSTSLCFFERAKASDRPFKKSSESSFTFHNDSISLLSNFRRSNSSLLCSLQPCLLCALCLRFLRRAGTSYLQSLSSRFQFDCTPRSLSFCADSAGIRRVDPKLVDLASQRFTMVPFTRFRCSPRLKTRMTKTSKRTKQLSFSNLFLLRPAGAEVGRPGPQYRKLSAETWQDSQTSCAHMCTVSVVSQLISSISLSLCESRPGFAESNRNCMGVEVAKIAPSQKASQARCKIARTLPRVRSDQNELQPLARMWCTMPKRSSSTLSCMCTYSCQAGLVDL